MNSNLPPLRALILDMDGVLWQDSQPIGDLPAIFAALEARHLKVIFATNNATKTIDKFQAKLARFNVHVESSQIVNSSMSLAYLLSKEFPQGGPVYIIGEQGLIDALAERGFYPAEENVFAVAVGLDRQLTFEKLRRATLLIRQGAKFYGANPDITFPTPEGLIPGCGTILAALRTSTSIEPIIAGKPAPYMYALAMARLGVTPAETLAVGDRLETDILGGQQLGCRTALVLSGVTTLVEAQKWTPQPDFITPTLTDLVALL